LRPIADLFRPWRKFVSSDVVLTKAGHDLLLWQRLHLGGHRVVRRRQRRRGEPGPVGVGRLLDRLA
jgi:hypothetical protein